MTDYINRSMDQNHGVQVLRKDSSGGDTSNVYRDTKGRITLINLFKLLTIALLKKAGSFETYKKTLGDKYDSTAENGHQARHLEFLMDCIEAAKKYFPRK